MNDSLISKPTAFLPLALSFAALVLVVGHAAMFGVVHQPDEGAAAHIFQLLMVAQVPLSAYFAFKWLRRIPVATLRVIALQIGAACLAVAAVYWLT